MGAAGDLVKLPKASVPELPKAAKAAACLSPVVLLLLLLLFTKISWANGSCFPKMLVFGVLVITPDENKSFPLAAGEAAFPAKLLMPAISLLNPDVVGNRFEEAGVIFKLPRSALKGLGDTGRWEGVTPVTAVLPGERKGAEGKREGARSLLVGVLAVCREGMEGEGVSIGVVG